MNFYLNETNQIAFQAESMDDAVSIVESNCNWLYSEVFTTEIEGAQHYVFQLETDGNNITPEEVFCD